MRSLETGMQSDNVSLHRVPTYDEHPRSMHVMIRAHSPRSKYVEQGAAQIFRTDEKPEQYTLDRVSNVRHESWAFVEFRAIPGHPTSVVYSPCSLQLKGPAFLRQQGG